MTKTSELPDLFEIDPKTSRVVAFAGNCGVAKDNDPTAAIAVIGTLLDPKTKKATTRQLFVQMQPVDALGVAETILQIAKDRGWKLPPGVVVQKPVRGTRH